MEMTIDKFIKRLEQISPNKRKLPLVMYAPNGMECVPNIKMGMDPLDGFSGDVKRMVITWND